MAGVSAGSPPALPSHSPVLLITSLVSVYLAWGSTYLAIRIALTGLPPFLLAGLRGIVAGMLLLVWGRVRGHSPVSGEALRNAAGLGVLMVAGANGLVTYAEQWVSSGLAASIAASGSIWLVLILAFLGERPTRPEASAVALGVCGVVLLNLDGQLRASPAGAFALFVATMSWAVGAVLTRRLVLPQGSIVVGMELLSGGLVMTVGGLFAGERIVLSLLTRDAVLAWLYLVVAGSLVGFSAFTFLIRNVRPALATSFVYVNPLVAVLVGVAFGGETVTPMAGVGIVVSVIALAAVTLTSRSRA